MCCISFRCSLIWTTSTSWHKQGDKKWSRLKNFQWVSGIPRSGCLFVVHRGPFFNFAAFAKDRPYRKIWYFLHMALLFLLSDHFSFQRYGCLKKAGQIPKMLVYRHYKDHIGTNNKVENTCELQFRNICWCVRLLTHVDNITSCQQQFNTAIDLKMNMVFPCITWAKKSFFPQASNLVC